MVPPCSSLPCPAQPARASRATHAAASGQRASARSGLPRAASEDCITCSRREGASAAGVLRGARTGAPPAEESERRSQNPSADRRIRAQIAELSHAASFIEATPPPRGPARARAAGGRAAGLAKDVVRPDLVVGHRRRGPERAAHPRQRRVRFLLARRRRRTVHRPKWSKKVKIGPSGGGARLRVEVLQHALGQDERRGVGREQAAVDERRAQLAWRTKVRPDHVVVARVDRALVLRRAESGGSTTRRNGERPQT